MVRAEEYAALDARGDIETPRPPTPNPSPPTGAPGASARSPRVDDGLVLDPDVPLSPLQAAERLACVLLPTPASGSPEPVQHDSARALETHPDVVVLMSAAFLIVEWHGNEPWTPGSGLQAAAHDARRTLAFALTWMEPRTRGLIPYAAETDIDAHTFVAENTSPAVTELAAFADAADRLRAGRLNEVEVHGTVSRIGRTRRLLRWGPDGPESPRPSDTKTHAPDALHPRLDEHGTVHFEESVEGEASS
ncbi:DUF5954 family protein [Streptomyces sp. NPDC087219]|uniref:DUF5954 family protein n=1 Tax=Streptomyces sp. NPDC087219 TaxID=3365770 RepID=UPI0038056EBE